MLKININNQIKENQLNDNLDNMSTQHPQSIFKK